MANALKKAARSLGAKAQANSIKLTAARRPLWMEFERPTELHFRSVLVAVDGVASGLTHAQVQRELRCTQAAAKRFVLAIQELARTKPLKPALPMFDGLPEQTRNLLTAVFERLQRHLRRVEAEAWASLRTALNTCEGLHAPSVGWADNDLHAIREALKGADLGLLSSQSAGQTGVRLTWRTRDGVDLTPWVVPALALTVLMNECSYPRKRLAPNDGPSVPTPLA